MVTNLGLGSILDSEQGLNRDSAPGSDLDTALGSANKRTFSISFKKNTFIKVNIFPDLRRFSQIRSWLGFDNLDKWKYKGMNKGKERTRERNWIRKG